MVKIEISKQQFWQLVEQGYKVIDVRTIGEDIATGLRFPNSINFAYPKVINQANKLFPDKAEKLIFVCNYGSRSGLCAKSFKNIGYENVFVLSDGLFGLK